MKKALITGVTGQDGSYLTELLLDKGYEVHGLVRRSSSFNSSRLDAIYQDPHDKDALFFKHYSDLTDSASLLTLIADLRPDEIYNLGAQSHVKVSFEVPEATCNVTGLGVTRVLEAIRASGVEARFYQASSCEIFGSTPPPQNEDTPFHPRSPYAVAKAFGHWMTVNYREAHGMFACNGILFNHESPRRGENFLTRKITRAVARISAGMQSKLYLGNLDSKKDWGYAPEYVEAMWMMLQQDEPADFVVATGFAHTPREFCQIAFAHVGLDWQDYVEIDPRYYRPSEVDYLLGDPSKAREVMGWTPKTGFDELVQIMVDADLNLLTEQLAGRTLPQAP